MAGLALALWGAARLRIAMPGPGLLVGADGEKPAFPDGPVFSLAHSAHHVACVLAEDVQVGLDFEAWPDDPASIAKLRRWTASEAVLKAAGRGLRAIDEVEVDEAGLRATLGDARFVLHPAELGPGLLGYVAATTGLQIDVQPVDLYGTEASALFERDLGLASQVEQDA